MCRFSAVKLLRKTASAQYILLNHTEDTFPFLKNPQNTNSRYLYYSALAKILLVSEDTVELDFWNFIKPFSAVLEALTEKSHSGLDILRTEEVRVKCLCLFKELRYDSLL